jgi:Tfp pilus assembly protein PilX
MEPVVTASRATPVHRMRRRPHPPRRREQGIVVFVALIAVVLMSLAAVGLMRTVHTSTLVVGNLAFRQAGNALATSAVEKAVYDLFPPTKSIADLTNHLPARNYYAFRQAGENPMGIPAALQGANPPPAYPAGAQVISDPNDPSGQSQARYVVERMCLPASLGLEAKGQFCEMIPPKQSGAGTGNVPVGINVPDIPYYRMTVRVDGPNNSVAFYQGMLR